MTHCRVLSNALLAEIISKNNLGSILGSVLGRVLHLDKSQNPNCLPHDHLQMN